MPVSYGSRLMPVVVDHLAKQDPGLKYAAVPLTTHLSDGFKYFTFADIATATNHVAWWIERTLGKSQQFTTIAYMGPGDLRYVVVFLAAVKCGYKVLLPSLRNPGWMNASLLEQTNCSHLLYAPDIEGLVVPLLEKRPGLQLHPIDPLEKLIKPNTPHYPYEKSYQEAKWDPILILHSSGSTGAPRPIEMNHATFAVGDNDRNLPTIPGRTNQNWSLWNFAESAYFFSPFPAFHLAGFSSMIMLPIYYPNATLVLSPPTRPPTGHLVSEIMDHLPLKAIFCPPIIAEQLAQEPSGLSKCASLSFLLYAGGPLSQSAGDALSAVTDVCQFYGSTETGPIQALVPKRADWASLEWHPAQEVVMEPAIDGAFEMVLLRNPALEGVRSVSCNFPDVDVWRTKDLFVPHPDKPGLWRFHGRTDDIVVLANGEKFNPVSSETQIGAHPLLNGALIVGNGRERGCLILELKDWSCDARTLIDELWETVEKANAEAQGHARITRDMILVGSQNKPFDRSPKGTVVRGSTTKKYEEEIERMYAQDVWRNRPHIKFEPPFDAASTRRFVKDVVAAAFSGHRVKNDEDFFVLGLDSLQTAEIISLLKTGILTKGEDLDVSWVTPKLVYGHPSIISLSEKIQDHLSSPTIAPSDVILNAEERKRNMERLVEKYTASITEIEMSHSPVDLKKGLHVLLTGSTGSLGLQLLAKLLTNSNVSKIICLDRSADARERVTQSFSTWSPKPDIDASRISFQKVDYSQPDLGLSAMTINSLRATAGMVIHNAWKVDFNHSLASFEAVHLRGLQNLANFCASSFFRPRLIFISSISSVGDWIPAARTNIPEQMPPTPAVAQPFGYAESKAVAEQILARAASQSNGIKASILRIGQIAGPVGEGQSGRWNEHEWFPLLLKTSKALGKIPDADSLDNIDWLPIDVLASAVMDIMVDDEQLLQVYHLINPTVRAWSDLLPAIQSHLGGVKAVPMSEWVAELEKMDHDDRDAMEKYPAAKILSFFSNQRRLKGATSDTAFSTENSERCSSRLTQLGPVQPEWVARWMNSWEL